MSVVSIDKLDRLIALLSNEDKDFARKFITPIISMMSKDEIRSYKLGVKNSLQILIKSEVDFSHKALFSLVAIFFALDEL